MRTNNLDCGSDYLDLKTLSKRLSLSPRTLRSHIYDPDDPLPAYRIGGKLIFRWEAVQQWVERRAVVTTTAADIERMAAELL